MNKIVDFKCTYDNLIGIRKLVTESTNLTFPDAYKNWDSMAELALAIKEHNHANYCELPFCHTLEGEALGGIIYYGDENGGPRGKEYICSTAEELLSLPAIDYSQGRMAEVLQACSLLRNKGENVVLYISGPFTILNVLMDPRYIFKIFKKNPAAMQDIFDKLASEIIRFVEEAQKVDVNLISYGDAMGGVNILGPKFAKQVVEMFTYPFLKRVEEIIRRETILLLCPKTTFALLGTERAQWRDIDLGVPTTYSEACVQVIGQAKFVGQMCFKNNSFELKKGIIKAVDLL
ncbi:uroporphyrinogen decarboxylase family protein [Bacillus benzoevorans]|uniref:Uroporphyrinogen-III decarboxylase n=1 Tax=Bacillus benzoevorans TaxID=1456 RepID=A0A7X0LUC6_9BACI|nr:uroporphyrinogen decarboxylase family protein [Bacillus benzoevorans]MBB6444388.1 uroporphyrinogen-III decarboxylase [Bacillus benzoevorans]